MHRCKASEAWEGRREAARGRRSGARGASLNLLEADIQAHPERLKAFDGALHDRMQALVGDVDVDLEATLAADDE
nr:type II toxin-antitoxin system PrlF family antitoxin [Aminobacter aminovorans]